MNTPYSDQFVMHKVTRSKPVKAFQAYIAVWSHGDSHIILAAPTLEGLKDAWTDITEGELIEKSAQFVDILKAETQ